MAFYIIGRRKRNVLPFSGRLLWCHFCLVHGIATFVWFMEWPLLFGSWNGHFCLVHGMATFVWFMDWPLLFGSLNGHFCLVHGMTTFVWFMEWPLLFGLWNGQFCLVHGMATFVWFMEWPLLALLNSALFSVKVLASSWHSRWYYSPDGNRYPNFPTLKNFTMIHVFSSIIMDDFFGRFRKYVSSIALQ